MSSILSHVANGETLDVACGLSGASYIQLQRAIERGQYSVQDHLENGSILSDDGAIYQDIALAVAQFKSSFRQALMESGDWRATMAYYERLMPSDFGRRQVLAVETNNKITIEVRRADGMDWRAIKGGEKQEILETAFTDVEGSD